MATVTKLKAAVNNKNLPILTSEGELTNYYVGMYLDKIEETGYSLSVSEKTAINAFIDSAIQNGYINYIQYMLPFIGDSSHSKAGIVPLIDNVDNYEMSEYTGEEDYATNFFEYDSVTDKIKSVHNTRNTGDFIKTPISPSIQDNAVCIYLNANYETVAGVNIISTTEPANNVEGTNYYLRFRYGVYENIPGALGLFNTTSPNLVMWSKFRKNVSTIVSNNYNANFGFALKNISGESKLHGWSDIEFTGYADFGDDIITSADKWLDLNYGKHTVGRNLSGMYLKTLIYLDLNIPKSSRQQLSTDLFTLVTALGR